MVNRAESLRAGVAKTSAIESPLGSSARTDFVLDLPTESPQLDFDSTPTLSADAALLVAARWKLLAKRLLDLVGAALALLLLSPLLLATAGAVKFSSPGPVLFRQRRSGEHGRVFAFYKFRSMHLSAEEERNDLLDLNDIDGPVFKIRADPRMTRVGRLIRRASIDELPQLWNVIRGDMSLVGPRPLPIEEAEACSDWEAQRLTAKPGITCIWQVSGRSELDFDTWVRMDLQYIQTWSMWLDLKLLAKTVPAVLSGRGAY